MAGELVHGFVIVVDGVMVAVKTAFEDAVASASSYLPTSPSTTKVQICSASSYVVPVPGTAPSHLRTWNYDKELDQWVEFLR